MYNTIIIGAGPAGISASIYLKRANKDVLVLYYGESNLEKATKIENYYGFENGISGKDLYETGMKQARNLGIEVKNEQVINVQKIQNFVVTTTDNKYESKNVILATGNKKLRPNIKGIEEFEGKGISYCAICDGFFFRNKNVAVIGNGEYAISEAKELAHVASNIKILTNGEQLHDENGFEIINKKISKIIGEKKVKSIIFEDGSKLDIDGIFIAIGEAGAVDFARKIGVGVKDDNIIVDENMKTNVPGLYACGNSTGGLLQVNKAVYEGAKAAISIIKDE